MLIHSVYYWLREDLTAAEQTAFREGLDTLARLDDVLQGYVCACGPTRRGVVDSSYAWALVLIFDDLAAHDRYQADPVHEAFRRDHARCIARAVVYDCTT